MDSLYGTLEIELARVTAQRDALAAALAEIVRQVETRPDGFCSDVKIWGTRSGIMETARAALAGVRS
jgi:hypothetical protein